MYVVRVFDVINIVGWLFYCKEGFNNDVVRVGVLFIVVLGILFLVIG